MERLLGWRYLMRLHRHGRQKAILFLFHADDTTFVAFQTNPAVHLMGDRVISDPTLKMQAGIFDLVSDINHSLAFILKSMVIIM